MPTPVTDEAYITVYVDASHACNVVTRRSVTGILLCVNKTPIRWYSKRQNTVETSTYGFELVAARIAAELAMEYRYKLRMMGFKVSESVTFFIDNQSVVTNTSLPSSPLKKKHNAIAYHRVREAIAAKILKVYHLDTEFNRADILTKALPAHKHQYLLKHILYP